MPMSQEGGFTRELPDRSNREAAVGMGLLRGSKHCLSLLVAGTLSTFKDIMELGRRDGRRPTENTTNPTVLTEFQLFFLNKQALD